MKLRASLSASVMVLKGTKKAAASSLKFCAGRDPVGKRLLIAFIVGVEILVQVEEPSWILDNEISFPGLVVQELTSTLLFKTSYSVTVSPLFDKLKSKTVR